MIRPPGVAALVVSHPGHELRVHHWMEVTHPAVFVLTDGSGHTGISRLATTRRIIERAGATAGAVFGVRTDHEMYAAMLDGNTGLFAALAATLAESLLQMGATTVACDAEEGYNPSHDLCRYLTEAAVRMARAHGAAITGFDFPLVGSPTAGADALAGAVRLTLDDLALGRKIDSARSYPEIAKDVDEALRTHGRETFGVECLRPMTPIELSPARRDVPFYERHGAQQVAKGHYDRVLRFTDHVLPIAAVLRDLTPAVV